LNNVSQTRILDAFGTFDMCQSPPCTSQSFIP